MGIDILQKNKVRYRVGIESSIGYGIGYDWRYDGIGTKHSLMQPSPQAI